MEKSLEAELATLKEVIEQLQQESNQVERELQRRINAWSEKVKESEKRDKVKIQKVKEELTVTKDGSNTYDIRILYECGGPKSVTIYEWKGEELKEVSYTKFMANNPLCITSGHPPIMVGPYEHMVGQGSDNFTNIVSLSSEEAQKLEERFSKKVTEIRTKTIELRKGKEAATQAYDTYTTKCCSQVRDLRSNISEIENKIKD